MFKPVRRLYDWMLHWADTPYGLPALCLLAFAESSFFPIPVDPLLLALAIGRPDKAIKFGIYCTLFSVLGGVFGYGIGLYFMDALGFRILELYGVMDKYEIIQALYQKYDAWAVGLAGLTPLPYKVFTIAAGAFEINFPIFVFASLASRGFRFLLEALLIWKFGGGIKEMIEKYFEVFTVIFAVCLIGGFLLLKVVL